MRGIKNMLFLGIWLFIVPFLGIQAAWKEGLILATAFLLLAASGVRLFAKFAQPGVDSKARRVSAPSSREGAARKNSEEGGERADITEITPQ